MIDKLPQIKAFQIGYNTINNTKEGFNSKRLKNILMPKNIIKINHEKNLTNTNNNSFFIQKIISNSMNHEEDPNISRNFKTANNENETKKKRKLLKCYVSI